MRHDMKSLSLTCFWSESALVCQSDGAIVVWRIGRLESRYPALEIVSIVPMPRYPTSERERER